MTAAVPPATAPVRARSALTFWGDRPVRVKVLVAVGVTALVAVLIGVLGLSALSATQQRQESLYVDVTIPIADLGEVDATLGESNFLISALLLETHAEDDAAIVQEIADVDAALDESFASYTATRAVTPTATSTLTRTGRSPQKVSADRARTGAVAGGTAAVMRTPWKAEGVGAGAAAASAGVGTGQNLRPSSCIDTSVSGVLPYSEKQMSATVSAMST